MYVCVTRRVFRIDFQDKRVCARFYNLPKIEYFRGQMTQRVCIFQIGSPLRSGFLMFVTVVITG